MKNRRKHIITLVNNPSFENPEHFLESSVRESRAVRQARKLEKAGNRNIMLFRIDKLGNRHRVSTRKIEREFAYGRSHKAEVCGEPIVAGNPNVKKVAHALNSKKEELSEMVDFYRAASLARSMRTA